MASEKTLRAVCKDTANAIRSKTGKTDKIKPINFADEINNITLDNTTLNGLIDRTITEISNDTVTSVGENAFNRCIKLTTALFPNATIIKSTAFYDCFKLVNTNFSSVEIIESSGLNGPAASKFDFPKLAQIKGSYNFYNCSSLKTVIIRTPTVCTLANTNAFSGTPIATSTTEGYIYVPDELVDSYKTATNWSTYATKIKGLSELPNS